MNIKKKLDRLARINLNDKRQCQTVQRAPINVQAMEDLATEEKLLFNNIKDHDVEVENVTRNLD